MPHETPVGSVPRRVRILNRWNRVGSGVNPKAYVLLSLVLGAVLGTGVLSYEAHASLARKLDGIGADQAARDRRYNERKALQDTINSQTIKLLADQQDEIDALKRRR